jgi:hypothetical protein
LSADAAAILEALRRCASEPMGLSDIRRIVFSGHRDAAEIDNAFSELEARGYVIGWQEGLQRSRMWTWWCNQRASSVGFQQTEMTPRL